MTRRRPKARKRTDPVSERAMEIGVPAAQIRSGVFTLHDVSNYTDDDQRRMHRSGERQTVRRKPKVHELLAHAVITPREAAACDWYATMHSARYDTGGTTANYGGAGGRSATNYDHLPKTKAQQQAFDMFTDARAGIHPQLVGLFERVVLHHRPLGRLTRTFRLAIAQLIGRIEGRVQL